MRRLQCLGSSALLLSAGLAAAAPPPPQTMLGFHGKRLGAIAPHQQAGHQQAGHQQAGQHAAPRQTDNTSIVFTFLDYPGTSYTGAFAINPGVKANAKTLLVGSFGPGLGDTWESPVYGFGLELKNTKGVMSESYRSILPGQSQVSLNGVNDKGLIAGTLTDANNVATGFTLAPDGTRTTIVAPYPNAPDTTVTGVNNKGLVIGVYYTYDVANAYPFTYQNGAYTQLPLYPGSSYVWPNGINNLGDSTGNLIDQNGVNHGYLYKNGTFTLIDPPGSVYTIAIGLNDSDEIVGFYCTTLQDCTINGPEDVQGFVYSNGVYTTINVPGSWFTELDTLNDAGTIVGNYWDQNGFVHSFLTPTPN